MGIIVAALVIVVCLLVRVAWVLEARIFDLKIRVDKIEMDQDV